MLLDKFPVLLFVVAGAANDIKTGLFQSRAIVAKAHGLCCATRGVVFWIKIQNQLLFAIEI